MAHIIKTRVIGIKWTEAYIHALEKALKREEDGCIVRPDLHFNSNIPAERRSIKARIDIEESIQMVTPLPLPPFLYNTN